MKSAVGDLDRIDEIVKVFGMVNAGPDFMDHPKVINGCSDLFVEVFGERGRHARSAVGMSSLPGGIPVEIEAIVAVRQPHLYRTMVRGAGAWYVLARPRSRPAGMSPFFELPERAAPETQ